MSIPTCDKPIAPPMPTTGNKGIKELTKEQQDSVARLLEHFSADDYEIPDLESGKLLEDEKMWLSYECLQRWGAGMYHNPVLSSNQAFYRFLRAVDWQTTTAISRIESTLKWRRDTNIHNDMRNPNIAEDAKNGGVFLFGYDREHNPIIHCLPGSILTDDAERQAKLLMWIVERGIDLTGPGVERIDIFVNYANQTRNFAWKAAYDIVSQFQGHYPEVLGRAIVNNAPWYLNAFFKIIIPFLEPVTREKLRFEVPVLKEELVSPDMIMSEWYSGDQDFKYVHDKYYPALMDMCEEMRKRSKEKWKSLGGVVGLKEREFKSGHILPTAPEVPL